MITTKFSGSTQVTLSNGQHSIIADVAKDLGGGDEGLNPHELVEAALGACTALTLELYARRKSWNIEGMKVKVEIVKEGAESEIKRTITFGPHQNDEERKRLLDIAEKCPIHKLLTSKIEIKTYEE